MARADDGESIDRPLVVDCALEHREYQRQLAEAALTDHTLVCLPTGLGKTAVSLLVTAERLAGDVVNKSLLLAPTKPLVTQHAEFYRAALDIADDEVVVYTGETRPDDRADLWTGARVVVATPEVVENDLVGSRVDLTDVVHCTFDECHRATGDYAYNYIAERYHDEARDPLVTGMSASPGDDEEAILTVCSNLGLRQVEVMTDEDADVAEYTHRTDVQWERVELPESVVEIRDALNEVIRERLTELKELGVTSTTRPDVSEREIQKIQGKLRELMDSDQSEGYEGMSYLAEVRKLRTAVTYAETQSVESLRRYFERQKQAARASGASKADQRMVSDPKVREAVRKAEAYDDLHPKFRRAREHFETRKFVGQSDTEGSDGMTQTRQQETLEAFRDGEFEVLVSTSVAEEGLDVPEVDLVLFYEPVPTAIRAIQRKGRTGRQTEGAVTVLLAEDTRDEAYFWKARRDQKRMREELRSLKSVADRIEAAMHEQSGIDAFAAADPPTGPSRDGEPAGGTGETTGDDGVPPETGGEDATDLQPSGSDGAPTSSGPARETAAGATESDDGDGQAGLDAFAGGDGSGETGEGGKAPGGDGGAADSEAIDGDSGATDGEDGESGTVPTPGGDDAVEVVVDQRELDAPIAKDLSRRDGLETRLETLAVGDYVLSDRVVVERKTVADFLDTLTGDDERSLFEQAKDATRYYARPVVVLEGADLYEQRNVHPNAIQGALASLTVDFGASVLRTTDADETAALIEAIATREQEESDRTVSVHGEKSSKTLAEQQEYVVASVAEVGPVTAQSLLAELGSVEAVVTADADELQTAEGVGEVTAQRIREVVGSDYDG
ncbi:Hef nuclease [Halobacteriales archaeon QH_10_67_22]|nr:MAG: Hef nuclease [Halobacteriales archaeon QH_10_67_22]